MLEIMSVVKIRSIVPVKKCNEKDCCNVDLYYAEKRGDKSKYCATHAVQYGLVHYRTGHKHNGLCNNIGCSVKGVIAIRDMGFGKYCYDYSIIHHYNSTVTEDSSRLSKCSELDLQSVCSKAVPKDQYVDIPQSLQWILLFRTLSLCRICTRYYRLSDLLFNSRVR